MKISEILKQRNLFSKDIKQRFANKQIKLNGEACADIDVDLETIFEVEDFVFKLCKDDTMHNKLRILGLEGLCIVDKNFAKFVILEFSKKDKLVLVLN